MVETYRRVNQPMISVSNINRQENNGNKAAVTAHDYHASCSALRTGTNGVDDSMDDYLIKNAMRDSRAGLFSGPTQHDESILTPSPDANGGSR